MTILNNITIKHEHQIPDILRKLKISAVVLNVLSVVALVFPIIPLALLAAFTVVQIPATDAEIMSTVWFLGGPAGMVGLTLAIFRKRNIIIVALLIYGVATYSPLLFPFYTEITSKGLFHILYTLYFSIPVIVAVIHIGLSIRAIWIRWRINT